MHPIFGTRKRHKKIKTYFTGSADFIWKRTHTTTEYGDVLHVDTLSTASTGQSVILNSLETETESFNQYNFNIGPGIFFVIENENISVRIHAATGYSRTFIIGGGKDPTAVSKEESDVFFAGRAWITEPYTGITLQAEITNRFIEPKPSYVVTLSKAFHLNKLSGIFSSVKKGED